MSSPARGNSLLDEEQAALRRSFASVTQTVGPLVHPVFERITSEHISQSITKLDDQNIREYAADASRRRYQFIYFFIGLLAVVGLAIFFTLTDNKDILIPLVTAIAGFAGGFALGLRFRS